MLIKETSLRRLGAWSATHSDGDREHRHGIRIETTDNPGWLLAVDLPGTPLEGEHLANETRGVPLIGPEWFIFGADGERFEAVGGLLALGPMIDAFLAWAEPIAPIEPRRAGIAGYWREGRSC